MTVRKDGRCKFLARRAPISIHVPCWHLGDIAILPNVRFAPERDVR
jgi:hypothetical protein